MRRYFFDIANGHRLIDPGGLDCASDEDAIEKAKFIARRIADEMPAGATRQIAIRNEDGRDVSMVPVHEEGLPQAQSSMKLLTEYLDRAVNLERCRL